jgi:carnitine 3-dehydrogenase
MTDPLPDRATATLPRRACVVGTGVIGAGWTAVLLARGVPVTATDPAAGAHDRLVETVRAHWPTMRLLGAPEEPDLALLDFTADPQQAVQGADLVQENGPEVLDLKQRLFAALDEAAGPEVVLASSSSGLTPSELQAGCTRHPERVLVGHPFNPVHVVPLVEVVPGRATAEAAVQRAIGFYRALGKTPVHVRAEVPGHVANRLQAALWKEAYSLVERGVATVADIDTAIANGPGLRWAVLGPFVNQHLSGLGAGGLAHVLEHLGPPMAAWWKDLGDPELTAALVDLLVRGVDDELAGRSDADLAAARDRLVVGLLAAKAEERELP